MQSYRVAHDARAVVTVDGVADAAAIRRAVERLEGEFENASIGEESVAVSLGNASVAEHPATSFDPYRVEIPFRVSITVEAADEAAARETGTDRIADALSAVSAEWEFVNAPTVERT